jgi:transcriptional regulator with XRE-family HTH domain
MKDTPDHPLASWRRANRLTQDALGDLLGVEAMTVSRWENGSSLPRTKLWPKIREVTGVTPEQLAASRAEVPA